MEEVRYIANLSKMKCHSRCLFSILMCGMEKRKGWGHPLKDFLWNEKDHLRRYVLHRETGTSSIKNKKMLTSNYTYDIHMGYSDDKLFYFLQN